jgi:hypothetical protein
MAWRSGVLMPPSRSGRHAAKELLGGLIIVEVDTMEDATAMASEWPSLSQGPGAGVQVEAVAEH